MLSPGIALIVAALACANAITYPCTTPNDKEGFCINFFDCPTLKNASCDASAANQMFFEESLCDTTQRGKIKVCCPIASHFHITSPSVSQNELEVVKQHTETSCGGLPQPCQCDERYFKPVWIRFHNECRFFCKDRWTRYMKSCREVHIGEKGQLCPSAADTSGLCTARSSCRGFVENRRTLTESLTCQQRGRDQVCCDFNKTVFDWKDTVPHKKIPKESHRDFVLRKLLPTRTYCGFQQTDDRVYNSTKTALDEHPWLVHVIRVPADDNLKCNGFLISSRYVLTSFFCGRNAVRIILGQHTTNREITCSQEDSLNPECTDPITQIEVEESFPCTDLPYTDYRYNNIILLRLAKAVSYTNYIRPLCLPLGEDIRSQTPNSLLVTGWGDLTQKEATKKRLLYRIGLQSECSDEYYDVRQRPAEKASVEFMCLVAVSNNTEKASFSDHGGPAMLSFNHQWFALSTVADVYPNDKILAVANIPDTVEWIIRSMRE